jgi:hypothetical protein
MKKLRYIKLFEQFVFINESKLVEPKFIVVNELGTEVYENFEEAYEFIQILHEQLTKLAPDDSVCNLENNRMLNRVYNTGAKMVEKLREKHQLPLDNPELDLDKDKIEQIRQWLKKNYGLADTELYQLAEGFAKQIGVTVEIIRKVKMYDFKTKVLKRKFEWDDKKVRTEPIHDICQVMMGVSGSWLRCCKLGKYTCGRPPKFEFPPIKSNVEVIQPGGAPDSNSGAAGSRSGDTFGTSTGFQRQTMN